MDYSGSDFTKLKYTNALTFEFEGVNPILTYIPTTISTRLCLESFYHWIKNLDSPISKHNKLLASHHGDLRLVEYWYPYPLWATLDSRVLHSWSCSIRHTPTSHLYAIPVSSHYLIMRTINAYGSQWPTLNYRYCPSNCISFGHELV